MQTVEGLWLPLKVSFDGRDRRVYLVWAPGGAISKGHTRGVHTTLEEHTSTPYCTGEGHPSIKDVDAMAAVLSTELQNQIGELVLPKDFRISNPPLSRSKTVEGKPVGSKQLLKALEASFLSHWLEKLNNKELRMLDERITFESASPELNHWVEEQSEPWALAVGWLRARLGIFSVIRAYMDARQGQYAAKHQVPHQLLGPMPQLSTYEYYATWDAAEARAGYSAQQYKATARLPTCGAVGSTFKTLCDTFSPKATQSAPTLLDGRPAISTQERHAFCDLTQHIPSLQTTGSAPRNEIQPLASAFCTGRAEKRMTNTSTPAVENPWALGTRVMPMIGGHVAIQPWAPIQCDNRSSWPAAPRAYLAKVDIFPDKEPPTRSTSASRPHTTIEILAQWAHNPNPATDSRAPTGDQPGNFFVAQVSDPLEDTYYCPQTYPTCEEGAPATSIECPYRRDSLPEVAQDAVELIQQQMGERSQQPIEGSEGTHVSEINALTMILTANQYRRW